jgi:hypothetical protein
MSKWKLEMDAEVAFLRDYLGRAVTQDTEWSRSPAGQEITAQHQAKLDILNAKISAKEYHNEWRLFSATLDYCATGEGHTMIFMAEGASNMTQFLERVCASMSGYYAVGADLWDGLPPDNNRVFRQMVSKTMVNTLKSDIEAHEHWGSGNVTVYLEQHS